MRGRSLGVDTDFQAPSKRSQASSTCSATMGDDQEPLFRRAGWLMLGPLDSTRSGSAGACGSPCVANSRAGRRSRRCGSLPFAAGPRNGACHRPDYPKDAGTPWRPGGQIPGKVSTEDLVEVGYFLAPVDLLGQRRLIEHGAAALLPSAFAAHQIQGLVGRDGHQQLPEVVAVM